MSEPNIIAQARAAREAFEALSPVDQALHLSDQRRSFVRGMSDREAPADVLADEVRRLRAENARLREALKCADYLILLHERIHRREVVRDLEEATGAYRAALRGEP